MVISGVYLKLEPFHYYIRQFSNLLLLMANFFKIMSEYGRVCLETLTTSETTANYSPLDLNIHLALLSSFHWIGACQGWQCC